MMEKLFHIIVRKDKSLYVQGSDFLLKEISELQSMKAEKLAN